MQCASRQVEAARTTHRGTGHRSGRRALATSLTTVKTWVNLTGNDLVLVFKKRGTNERPSAKIFSHIDGDPEYLGY